VRNRSDGAVEAVFEGDPAAVESMVDFARSGPSSADVRSVEVDEEEPEGLGDFDVR
jgi:acylphosphatase